MGIRSHPAHSYCWEFHLTFLLLILTVCVVLFLCLRLRRHIRDQRHSELTDPVTGIGNATFFGRNFHNAITDETRERYYIVYLGFDSGRTSKFFGQVVSKQMIRYTANVLKQYVKNTDIVARISEDRFGIAFQSSSLLEAQNGVERLLDVLNVYGKTIGSEHEIPIRAGIYPLRDSDHSCETALFNAQQGYLYAAEHHIPLAFSNENFLQNLRETAERQKLIAAALKNHEFKLFLQFIVDRNTKQIRGAEALSRWAHPTKGLLSPGQYIGIMEELGSISELDFYIFREVCKQLEKWSTQAYSQIIVSCNFTRITISSPDFMARILEIAGQYRFDRSRLVIEITEDMEESNASTAKQNIMDCKNAGFRVALDDMGDGYSSFLNLLDYPMDYVKIDKTIIDKANTPKGQALLTGMVSLAHSMNIQVVCEGVETCQQDGIVCSSLCDFIQGFYYSKPIPQEAAENFIDKYCSVSV